MPNPLRFCVKCGVLCVDFSERGQSFYKSVKQTCDSPKMKTIDPSYLSTVTHGWSSVKDVTTRGELTSKTEATLLSFLVSSYGPFHVWHYYPLQSWISGAQNWIKHNLCSRHSSITFIMHDTLLCICFYYFSCFDNGISTKYESRTLTITI